jgi:DNA topoisomerase-3
MDAKFKGWSFKNLPILPDKYLLQAIPDSKVQLSALEKLLKRKDIGSVINGCDAGREGELIFRYIIDFASKGKAFNKPIQRLWLQSMTKESIKQAFVDLRSDESMLPLADSARCRSESDWLVGINATRSLTAWNSRNGGFFKTPAGRVQTPTLALMVDREQHRLDFVPQSYWQIQADFKVDKVQYSGKWFNPTFKKDENHPEYSENRLWTEAEAQAILDLVQDKIGTFTEESKSSLQKCPSLYDLTTLQREANQRFGFPARMTLNLAQSLYEKYKALTYPRTDSKYLPEDYLKNTFGIMKNLEASSVGAFAKEALAKNYIKPDKRIFDSKKVSDHHAIIPTGTIPKSMPEPEAKIFQMVLQRYVAIFFPAAEFLNTLRITTVEKHTFKTEGKILKVPGWKAVYGKTSDMDEDQELALEAIPVGAKPQHIHSELMAEHTKPSPRFSEATLLSAMEHAGKMIEDEELAEAMKGRGLGTPATRAATIEKLLYEKYILREGRELVPTRKAFDLLQTISIMNIDDLRSPELTGGWEHKLNQMEKGEISRAQFMKEIIELTLKIVDAAKTFDEDTVKKEAAFSPLNGVVIYEYPGHFESADGAMKLRKILGGRHMSSEEIHTLMEKKEVGPFSDFLSKKGSLFTAFIKLTEKGAEFVFDGGDPDKEDAPDFSVLTPIGKSMIDGSPVYETRLAFMSESYAQKAKTGFRLSKTILGITLTPEHCLQILEKGKTDLIVGFRSNKTKRLFDAYLCFDKAGKMSWQFPPRAPKAAKKEPEVFQSIVPDADGGLVVAPKIAAKPRAKAPVKTAAKAPAKVAAKTAPKAPAAPKAPRVTKAKNTD